MNTLLAQQLGDLLGEPAVARDALYEGPLRVAAGTLQRATQNEVSATTVVGIVGAEDVPAFESLVHQIADTYALDVEIRLRADAFSVRFSRRAPVATTPARSPGMRSILRAFLRG